MPEDTRSPCHTCGTTRGRRFGSASNVKSALRPNAEGLNRPEKGVLGDVHPPLPDRLASPVLVRPHAPAPLWVRRRAAWVGVLVACLMVAGMPALGAFVQAETWTLDPVTSACDVPGDAAEDGPTCPLRSSIVEEEQDDAVHVPPVAVVLGTAFDHVRAEVSHGRLDPYHGPTTPPPERVG